MKSKYSLFPGATFFFEISLILADKENLQMHVFRYHFQKKRYLTVSVLFKESIKIQYTSGF